MLVSLTSYFSLRESVPVDLILSTTVAVIGGCIFSYIEIKKQRKHNEKLINLVNAYNEYSKCNMDILHFL